MLHGTTQCMLSVNKITFSGEIQQQEAREVTGRGSMERVMFVSLLAFEFANDRLCIPTHGMDMEIPTCGLLGHLDLTDGRL
jgi:hypothetical protein